MDSYEQLLAKAYSEVKVVEHNGERFTIPKVEGQVSGNTTIITNIEKIAGYLRRPVVQISKFLQKELAVVCRMDNGRLIFNARIPSGKVNEKVEFFTREFVLCPVCGKPDTEIVNEKGIRLKHCLACGANSPVKYHI